MREDYPCLNGPGCGVEICACIHCKYVIAIDAWGSLNRKYIAVKKQRNALIDACERVLATATIEYDSQMLIDVETALDRKK